MVDKIAASLATAPPEVRFAAGDGHHLVIGPGKRVVAEWSAAGLSLPDLPAMRRYRVDRVAAQLVTQGYDGIIVMDPMNIRYVTDGTNMQLWVMHNGARYAFVSADGYVILWDYYGCEFLAAHSEVVDEVRPAIGSTYFLGGPRHAEQAARWSAELIAVIGVHCGANPRIAIDQCHHVGYRMLEEAGLEIGFGQEVMELARAVKGPDEILAMRCAVHACETTLAEMRAAMVPGMTERDLWSMLHAGNIRRAGEWIETQIIASGPRTNPWMQEASSRVIESGDIVAYDTDLVGAYGMMVDLSRTWIAGEGRGAGGAPTPDQQHTFDLAREQIEHNIELLTPGRSFRELTHQAWYPSPDEYRHYSCLFHGVGQCDEYPEVYFPEIWDEWGFDGELQAGMVLTVEAFVGPRHLTEAGDWLEGVKLENQVLVTDDGPELLTAFPLDLQPSG
ncbi:M24 family metallopeptidase [Ilumatobacter sp.]|uniref:M24 family metallopeptidase n=1 Tax=Ilumatobacter sp. TaxID=1967498 RepID=UPI003C44496D